MSQSRYHIRMSTRAQEKWPLLQQNKDYNKYKKKKGRGSAHTHTQITNK